MLTLTKELNEEMHPKKGVVYGGYSLPSYASSDIMEWSNPDAQYIIKLNLKTGIFTGHFYAFNEETEDWDDEGDVEMTKQEILDAIRDDQLLMVKNPRRCDAPA